MFPTKGEGEWTDLRGASVHSLTGVRGCRAHIGEGLEPQ